MQEHELGHLMTPMSNELSAQDLLPPEIGLTLLTPENDPNVVLTRSGADNVIAENVRMSRANSLSTTHWAANMLGLPEQRVDDKTD